MGAKIVDRVRRSLSRSRRPSEEKINVDDTSSQMLPPIPISPPPPHPSSAFENADKATLKSSKNAKTSKPKKTVVVKKKAVP